MDTHDTSRPASICKMGWLKIFSIIKSDGLYPVRLFSTSSGEGLKIRRILLWLPVITNSDSLFNLVVIKELWSNDSSSSSQRFSQKVRILNRDMMAKRLINVKSGFGFGLEKY